MWRIVWLVSVAGVAAASGQQPFSAPLLNESESTEYQFKWPIQRVAIIGAGPSGLVAYQEFTEAGLYVRIFERDSVPGGVWHYTEELPFDAPVPNAPVPIGDFVPSLPPVDVDLLYSEEFEDDGKIWRDQRGPKPIWASLTCTAPSPLQQFPHWPWPPGTPWELSHYQVRNYIRSYASFLNINSNDENPAISYNTRVERVEKRINDAEQEQGWRVWLRSIKPTQNKTYRATWWTEDFDAVLVTTGSYQAPSAPSIPGLEEWVRMFPDLVRHSRQYRRPEVFVNQTVLIIGASRIRPGAEISRDLNLHARKICQSFRPDNNNQIHFALENRLRRIPQNTTFIGEIKEFLPILQGSSIRSGLIELKNGTILSGMDSVIFATGLRYSFPFLQQYYDGATFTPHAGSAATVSPFLPSDGAYLRDLYLNQFYIQDPTLAFIGVSLAFSAFSSTPYTALALAKVWTNTAKLPDTQTMQAWHDKTIEERGGYSKYFMFLGPKRGSALLRYLIAWLSDSTVKYGGKQVDGLPKLSPDLGHYWEIAHYGAPIQFKGLDVASLGTAPKNGADQSGNDDVLFYIDEW